MNGMSDQSIGNTFHMPSYIRGSSYNGAIAKDEDNDTSSMQSSESMLNDFKNALRIISSDVGANKQHRNGDNGTRHIFDSIFDFIFFSLFFFQLKTDLIFSCLLFWLII